MRILILAAMASACAWTPHVVKYPSGYSIARVDQYTLDHVCSAVDDKGVPIGHDRHAVGCYDGSTDTIYLLNDCEGAEALPHELAHRDGIKDPEKAGYNW